MAKEWKLLLLSFLSFFLTACTDLNLANEESSSNAIETMNQTEDEALNIESSLSDQRFVPAFNQVEADLYNLFDMEATEGSQFVTEFDYVKTEEAYQLIVDEMRWYHLDEYEQKVLLILDLAISNLSDNIIYYPIEDLNLSYSHASPLKEANSDIYPSQTGDLLKILESVAGQIGPDQTVEGYLVYSFSQDEWIEARGQQNLILQVHPAYQYQAGMSDKVAEPLGEMSLLYLPLNQRMDELLIVNSQRIQDRLSVEWWGNKEVLAQTNIPINENVEDLSVTINRIEMSDFRSRKQYQKHFRNFSDGQIILSMEVLITNNSENDILINAASSSIKIMGNKLKSEEMLNEEFSELSLKPEESTLIRKVFVLDKKKYYTDWQGRPIIIELKLPINLKAKIDNSLIYNQARRELLQWTSKDAYEFEFEWQPVLEKYINEDLKVVEALNMME